MEKELDLYEDSKYYSDAEFINMFNEIHNEITLMNLNCCSLNARIDALKIFLATVDRHSRMSCITLQETWCDESTDMAKFILPGYIYHDNKFKRTEVSNHSGLIIYVHDDFFFSEIEGIELWRKDVNISNKYVIFLCL